MRVIGLDVHRSFAVSAVLEDGKLGAMGRIALERGFKTLAPPHLKEHAPAE